MDTYTVRGPTGPPGPRGERGQEGKQGAPGRQGIQGVPGPSNGPKGDTGDAGPQGPTGPTGATGAQGAKGDVGDKGADGTVWRTGTTVPDDALGLNGDWYLRSTNGFLYQKVTGNYNYVTTIIGATGAKGDTGAAGSNGTNGADGAAGATGATGATGPKGDVGDAGAAGNVWRAGVGIPLDALGLNGDMYFRKDNGWVYQKVTGNYNFVADIHGADGAISPPATLGDSVTGIAVTDVGGITPPGGSALQQIYCTGSPGDVVVSANPQVAPGTVEGQQLKIIITAPFGIYLADGNGLSLQGDFDGKPGDKLILSWDATSSVWSEDSRRQNV